MNITDGIRANSGIKNELELLLIARTRNTTFRIAKGTNSKPKMVMYHALAGFATMDA